MSLRCGWIFYYCFAGNLLASLSVKEFRKSVSSWQSYRQIDGCIVWNAHNTVFGLKRSATCALAVYFVHSTQPNIQGLVSRDSIVDRQFVTAWVRDWVTKIYFARGSGGEILWWARLCVLVCLCVCLSASISQEPRARYLPIFCACCL